MLAGSAAYAVSEVFGWKSGLSHGFHEARGFYAIIIAATGIGTLMSVFELDPIKALVWSRQRRYLRAHHGGHGVDWAAQARHGRTEDFGRDRMFAWAATALIEVAVAVMFATA